MGWEDRPEARLLLACARPRGQLQATAVREVLADDEIDWTALIELALHHGVTPALAWAFADAPVSHLVPDDIQAALRQYRDAARERNTQAAGELLAILSTLDANGITALPFKGPLLAEMVYGDLGQRPPGDLDFLVRERDVTRTCELLERRGYRDAYPSSVEMTDIQHAMYRRYQCEYQFIRKADGVVVEPHWAVAQRTRAVDLDYEAQFVRARRGALSGMPLLMHAPEDLLLLLCVHGAKHEWERLVWIRDVAELIARSGGLGLDLDLALARAHDQRCARLLLVGLEVAHQLLACRLTPAVVQALRGDREAGALAEEVIARLFVRGRSGRTNRAITRFSFRLHDHAASRVRYVTRTLFMPRREHIEMVALPGALVWLYYPLRWGHDYVALPLWKSLRLRRVRSRDRSGT